MRDHCPERNNLIHPLFLEVKKFNLVDKLTRPGYDHVSQLFILVVPVVDVG